LVTAEHPAHLTHISADLWSQRSTQLT